MPRSTTSVAVMGIADVIHWKEWLGAWRAPVDEPARHIPWSDKRDAKHPCARGTLRSRTACRCTGLDATPACVLRAASWPPSAAAIIAEPQPPAPSERSKARLSPMIADGGPATVPNGWGAVGLRLCYGQVRRGVADPGERDRAPQGRGRGRDGALLRSDRGTEAATLHVSEFSLR